MVTTLARLRESEDFRDDGVAWREACGVGRLARRSLEVTAVEERIGQIPMPIRAAGFERHCAGECRDRFAAVPGCGKRNPVVRPRRRLIPSPCEVFTVFHDRVRVLLTTEECVRDSAVSQNGVHVRGPLPEEGPELGDTVLDISTVQQSESEHRARVGIVRDRRPQHRQRLVVSAGALQRQRQVVTCTSMRPSIDDGLPQRHRRLILGISLHGEERQSRAQTRGGDDTRATVLCADEPAPQSDRCDDREYGDRHHRDVHPAFGSDLGVDGDDTRCRRQRHDRKHAQKPDVGAVPQRGHHGDDNENDNDAGHDDVGCGQRTWKTIVQNQPRRHERELHVPGEHHDLIEQVGRHRRHVDQSGVGAQSHRTRSRPLPDDPREHRPARRQAHVQAATLPPRVPQAGEAKCPVIRGHEDWRHGHRFLAEHPEGACADGQRLPHDPAIAI